MSLTYKTGLLITRDAEGGVRAVQLIQKESGELGATADTVTNIFAGFKPEFDSDSDSGSVRVPFVAVYKRRTVIELGELSDILKRQNLAEYVDLIRDSMVGWRRLDASDGSTLPFSQEALGEMVNVPEHLTSLIEGLGEAVGNRKALFRKNRSRPVGSGHRGRATPKPKPI